ncbi:MAG: hypothetical protein ABI555_09435, partial [Chloroflexota bacterium]
MNRQLTRIAGTLAGLAMAVSVAMPAFAVGPTPSGTGTDQTAPPAAGHDGEACREAKDAWKSDKTLVNLKLYGFCEIDRRLATIRDLSDIVDGSEVLTDAHAAALARILDDSRTGLIALRSEIATDSTIETMTADVRRISTDYRIYVLVARQVHLVQADDRVEKAVARLNGASDRLAAAIQRALESGKDVTEAQGHLNLMVAAITEAQSDVAGDAADVLAQTPTSWNAGTAKPILDAARASIVAARTDIRTA